MKQVTATYIGDSPRLFPGIGVVEPGEEVKVGEHELDRPDIQKKATRKKKSTEE